MSCYSLRVKEPDSPTGDENRTPVDFDRSSRISTPFSVKEEKDLKAGTRIKCLL